MNVRALIFFLSIHVIPVVFAGEDNLSLMADNSVKNMQTEYTKKHSALTGVDVIAKLERKYWKQKALLQNIHEELKEESIVSWWVKCIMFIK